MNGSAGAVALRDVDSVGSTVSVVAIGAILMELVGKGLFKWRLF